MSIRWGIDAGTSAHAIAVYEVNEAGKVIRILWGDEVIFGEPLLPKNNVTLMSVRRAKRMMRRQIERKAARLRKIGHLARMIGVEQSQTDAIRNCDVYEIRDRAAREKVTLPELIRVFLHFAKHRGYRGDLDEGSVRKAIDRTNELLAANSAESLGALWYRLKRKAEVAHARWQVLYEGGGNNVCHGTFILRKDVEAEWEAIFTEQMKHHEELRREYPIRHAAYFPDLEGKETATAHEMFHSAIFYQRPIVWKRDRIGVCALDPGYARCGTSQPVYQRYRIAKVLSDLRVKFRRNQKERELTEEERRKAFAFLCRSYTQGSKISLKLLNDELGLSPKEYRFNYERSAVGDMDGVSGLSQVRVLSTLHVFHRCECLEEFEGLSNSEQELALEFLSSVTKYRDILEVSEVQLQKSLRELLHEDAAARRRTVRATEADAPGVAAFLKRLGEKGVFGKSEFKLEDKRAPYGIGPLEKLTEGLLSGKIEYDLIHELYPQAEEKRTELRPLSEILIGNPIIDKALTQLDRMVRYALKRFGKPDEIVLELSREMSQSLAKRAEAESQNHNTEGMREKARKYLIERGLYVSSTNIDKCILRDELIDNKCPYCGKKLSDGIAFSAAAEIDHIIPQGEGGANRMSNKVLCCAACNSEKGQRTPYLWLQSGTAPANLQQGVKELAKKLAKVNSKTARDFYKKGYQQKAKNLETQESLEDLKDDFCDRQNVQASWIGKILLDYLGDICDKVSPSYGKLTDFVRHRLGMDTLLPEIRLEEKRPLYSKADKPLNPELFRRLFLGNTPVGFLSMVLEDEEQRKVQEMLQKMFDEDASRWANTSCPEPDEARRFDKMLACLRSMKEFRYNKRCDHRHHLVDAAIIGLCSRSFMQAANTFTARYGDLAPKGKDVFSCTGLTGEAFFLRREWKKRLLHYVPWHKPDRFPSGCFADATAYSVQTDAKGVQRFVSRADVAKLLAQPMDKIAAVIVQPHTLALLKAAKEKGEKEIRIRGNVVRKVKVYYKKKSLLEYHPDKDLCVVSGKGNRKYYQNSGYACCDFDRTTGNRIRLISLLEYQRLQDKAAPDGVIRVFLNDTVYDRKKKQFYIIRQFSARDGIKMKVCSDAAQDENLLELRSNFNNLVLISRKEQIGGVLRS